MHQIFLRSPRLYLHNIYIYINDGSSSKGGEENLMEKVGGIGTKGEKGRKERKVE